MDSGENMRKRWKRKSGYRSPTLTVAPKDLIFYDLFVNSFYDDWTDWRDGMRDWFSDYKQIKHIPISCKKFSAYTMRIKMNRKQKKLLIIRKKRKARTVSKLHVNYFD